MTGWSAQGRLVKLRGKGAREPKRSDDDTGCSRDALLQQIRTLSPVSTAHQLHVPVLYNCVVGRCARGVLKKLLTVTGHQQQQRHNAAQWPTPRKSHRRTKDGTSHHTKVAQSTHILHAFLSRYPRYPRSRPSTRHQEKLPEPAPPARAYRSGCSSPQQAQRPCPSAPQRSVCCPPHPRPQSLQRRTTLRPLSPTPQPAHHHEA